MIAGILDFQFYSLLRNGDTKCFCSSAQKCAKFGM